MGMEALPKMLRETFLLLINFIASKRSANPFRWLMEPTKSSLSFPFFSEAFLVTDGIFHNISYSQKINLVEMIKENTSQLILLVSKTEYLSVIMGESLPSLREIITKQMDVKEYQLISKEGTSSIEPLQT